MFAGLKKKLVLLYGITTSIVLITILIILYSNASYQSNQYQKSLFLSNAESIAGSLQSQGALNHTWVAEMEKKKQVYLYIEENGIAYPNMTTVEGISQEIIEELILNVDNQASAAGISLSTKGSSSSVVTTGVYEIEVDGDRFLAEAFKVPMKQNDLLLYVFAKRNTHSAAYLGRMVLYSAMAVLGVSFLFLFSAVYIGRILKPLEDGQKKQVEFVAAASHELRSPMTVIQSGLTSIKEEPATLSHFLPILEGESKRMTGLIQDLLSLATADAKAWSLKKELLDVDTFLIETYDSLCCLQDGLHGPITLSVPEESMNSIEADKSRLQQVLLILVDNSWSYTDPAKGICLAASNRKKGIRLMVIDHGPGIPDDQKERIFERFYQGERSRSDKKHYGLGLSIAKEIITLHGGKLYVKDTDQGGATFVIDL